jgi:hypothetical protein
MSSTYRRWRPAGPYAACWHARGGRLTVPRHGREGLAGLAPGRLTPQMWA